MPHDFLKPHWSRFIGPRAPDPVKSVYKPHSEHLFSSPYGPFPESPPDLNIHEFCFPPENPLPEDYPLFVNALTDETVTLHQFYARACALARVFRHDGPNPLGLGKSPVNDKEDGEILGLFSKNHIHYPMVAHACFRAELVFGGISPASTPFELWWVLRKMQITSLMCHESLLPVVVEALKLGSGENDKSTPLRLLLDPKKIIVLSDNPEHDRISGHPTLESLVRYGTTLSEVPRKLLGGDRMAYLFQSSGTSGLPKAMMISHKNGIHSGLQSMITAVQGSRLMGIEPLSIPSRLLGVIPMYHSYGMILWILRINLLQSSSYLLPKWDVELALKSIEKYQLTVLPLVPPLVRQIAQSPLTEKYDLSSVTGAMSGAAYLPPDVAHSLAKKLPSSSGLPIPSGYGLSEAASIASPAPPGLFGLEYAPPGTIGYLLPGMEGRVVDPDTLQEVPKGQKGELWARGNVVTPGYFKDPKATAEIFTEPGWLRTGDLVLRDEHDRLHYLDRLKEMIKVKGLQVAATEVEDTLLDHPEALVRDACVAGVDNGRGDGSLFVRAWVVLSQDGIKQGEEVVAQKLDEFVKQRLSRHKWITGGIEAVDSLPRTPSGKMLRREMRDRYHARIKAEGKSKL
ncbi:acetyl-CoA synthetase-like protein [Aaosphaeria arxii CBS 175.79]|uniref:Acetyl-CoA synthetase-like protein n=1 Tax=Aaosphaeria arxii CBS 175.79 TaxID=1450172 RepID=A0A6A5XSQ4_9PLEO|nr:acetyl-CoA synthetase-like protein [Aaosphaeria arxii CBS 175.79]KAF2015781.1 acetyl-CoA synthetase-like protein [Aaosphaeria arxii CBS 175.79]